MMQLASFTRTRVLCCTQLRLCVRVERRPTCLAMSSVSPSSETPKSRKAGVHNFLIQKHGVSSLKVLTGAAAALSLAHFSLDPVTRVESVRSAVHNLSLIWFGGAAAIGFVEAPVKFQAPTLTRPVGLDVGRHVFSALNKLEIPAATSLVYAYAIGATNLGAWALLPAACVALETVWVMPGLMRRAADVIAGKMVPKSPLHAVTGALAVVKLSVLLAIGLMLK